MIYRLKNAMNFADKLNIENDHFVYTGVKKNWYICVSGHVVRVSVNDSYGKQTNFSLQIFGSCLIN